MQRPSSTYELRLSETKIDWLSQDAPALGLHQSLDELLGYDVNWQWKWSGFNFGRGRYAVVDDQEGGLHRFKPIFDILRYGPFRTGQLCCR